MAKQLSDGEVLLFFLSFFATNFSTFKTSKPLKINRALLSVSDKTNLLPLAKALHKANIEIISTGGTGRAIRDKGIPVTDVSVLTGFEECLSGRVKTLHPLVHGGILGRTSYQPDVNEMEELGIEPIELVVVNLYPFKKAVQNREPGDKEIIEQIDIGGPTMVRAAAKNFEHVCVLADPTQYNDFIKILKEGEGFSLSQRRKWARQAFNHTADYDAHIANYFDELEGEQNPGQLNISLPKSQELRYGENPHQKAAVYGRQNDFIDCFHGKQLSYNNYLDIDAALNLISDFEDVEPACAIFKHTVPCGAAVADSLKKAWQKAFQTDTKSPYGGIVVLNKELDIETAKAIDEIFTEIILAPSFKDKALSLLQRKKNRRLIQIKKLPGQKRNVRSIFGGALSQESDLEAIPLNLSRINSRDSAPLQRGTFKVVTKRDPSEDEIKNLLFAWRIVKHVKSNGIVYARDGQTLGIGTGQTSRVASSEIAVNHAKEEGLSLKSSAIASDAFFPFADGIEAAAGAGATSAIQPGGSIRDEEVIKAADKHGMAMIFTGRRHFRH